MKLVDTDTPEQRKKQVCQIKMRCVKCQKVKIGLGYRPTSCLLSSYSCMEQKQRRARKSVKLHKDEMSKKSI